MDEIGHATEALATAESAHRQAEIDLQRYMTGPAGEAIKSYRDAYERLWGVVYDGSQHPSDRVFESDVQKGYRWLANKQEETRPYRVEASRLKDLVKAANEGVRVAKNKLKDAQSEARRNSKPARIDKLRAKRWVREKKGQNDQTVQSATRQNTQMELI